ncbi:MAG: SAF domain-containing protein [Verrucomicrobiales bacterium]
MRNCRGLAVSQLLLLIATLVVIFVFGYRQYARHFGAVPVVVASEPLSAGFPIAWEQLKVVKLPRDQVPPEAFPSQQLILGKMPSRAVPSGRVITGTDFFRERMDLKKLIPEGRVLYSLNLSNKTLPLAGISQGDSIDILVAGVSTEEKQRVANVLVRDARMIGYSSGGNSDESPDDGKKKGPLGVDLGAPPQDNNKPAEAILMVAILPEDVISLAKADGSGLHMALVLHGESDVGEERLTFNNHHRVEVIQGKESRIVAVPD